LLTFERQCWERGYIRVAGVDEAGRGPLAGPVVAAAVFCSRHWLETEAAGSLVGLTDSKQLTASRRRHFFQLLHDAPDVRIGVGLADVEEIDRLNILQATHLSMRRALLQLPSLPEYALVDGLPVNDLPCPYTAVIHGDGRSLLIAAASVIAKVTRDNLMMELDEKFPAYGFAQNKGYGTQAHIQALLRNGPTKIHRRSFRPVREIEAIRNSMQPSGGSPHVEENTRRHGWTATRRAFRESCFGFLG
jgi:ribonuclease HII